MKPVPFVCAVVLVVGWEVSAAPVKPTLARQDWVYLGGPMGGLGTISATPVPTQTAIIPTATLNSLPKASPVPTEVTARNPLLCPGLAPLGLIGAGAVIRRRLKRKSSGE